MRSNRNTARNRLKSNANVKAFVVSTKFVFAKNLIESNDVEAFLDLLENSKIGVNDIGEIGGPSYLLIAAEIGNLHLVQELIRRGADINYVDSDNWNALLIAVKEDNVDIVTELLDAGADIESRDCGGFCSLMWAAYMGKVEMVKLLLKRHASPNVYDVNQISPLIWASGRGFTEIVQILISHGAKVDNADKYGTTALIWASRKGHYEIVKRLLKGNANVDATGMFGWTPLIVATRGNYGEVVELILSYKPNTNANDAQGLTPLMTACKEGNINIVNLLLYHSAYVNLTDGNGDTSLIHACKAGFLPVVEALIKAHAAVDHQGADRKTALYCAVEKGHVEVIKALLKANANVELATRDGDTALMKAVRGRRVQVVRMLLDRKAKVSPIDKYGDNALHIAARAQSKTIMELLLRNPRNSQLLYRPNGQGETAFQLDAAHQKPILPTLFGAAPSARRVLEKETQLGYDLYSSAIANLLSEPSLKTPVCVGLFAKWGSGKSFLLGKLRNDLAAFAQDWQTNSLEQTQCECSLLLLISLLFGAFGALFGLVVGNRSINIDSNNYNNFNNSKNGNISSERNIDKSYSYDHQQLFMYVGGGWLISQLLLSTMTILLQLGHRKYGWSFARAVFARLRWAQLLIQICFAHPPQLDYEQISGNPVRFLFTDQPIKLSTDHSVGQLITEIHRSLWAAIQTQHGYLPVRMFRVFQPKPISSGKWRWRKVFCMIPTLFFVIAFFLCLVILLALLLTPSPLWIALQSHPIISYVLVAVFSVVGAWTLANLLIPLHILQELLFPPRAKTREQMLSEIQLMQSCIGCLDAFDGQYQTRLVIILDALESIYESDRLMSFLEAININFLSAKSSAYPIVPFIILLTLDPHHHVTTKSKEYLKTIVHLPFYLQNAQLRRVKMAQQVEPPTNQVNIAHSGSIKFVPGGLSKTRSRKGGSMLKAADSVISLSGQTGEAPIKVLLTDDYFSDVNLKSMRRIMNIVYIEGRLLKAFNLEFNWHKLTTWVNITEQWPLRASALIAFYELNEQKYNDDQIPLKMLYDRVSSLLGDVDPELLARDADEKKLGIFLSCNNAFQLGDLKIFSPFTVNLDPYFKRCVQEILSLLPGNGLAPRPSSANALAPLGANSFLSSTGDLRDRSKLAELSVEGVVSILRQLDGFDISMIDRYATALRTHNINGKVLANCGTEDLTELKQLLNFNFGDWLLFKRQVIENKQLLHLHRLAPSGMTVTLGTGTASNSMNNLNLLGTAAATSAGNHHSSCNSSNNNIISTNNWTSLSTPIEAPELPRRSDTRSPVNSLLLNLEKQVTMEEAALQSDVREDEEEQDEEERLSLDSVVANSNEFNVLYIGGQSLTQRMSPSILVDIEGHQIDETTPLVSPTKSTVSSSSSSGSPSKKRLERQKQLDPRETNL